MEAPPVTMMPVTGGTINMMEYLLQETILHLPKLVNSGMEDPFDFSREPWDSRRSKPAHRRPRHGRGQCGSRRHNASHQKEEQVLRLWQDLQALEMAEKKKVVINSKRHQKF